jgi:hypothetical protein
MFPGLTTKLSEETVASTTSITVKADLVKITGNTAIETIKPQFGGGFSGVIFAVPVDNTVATVTTGNIAIAVTMPLGRTTVLTYSKATGKWYPGAIS